MSFTNKSEGLRTADAFRQFFELFGDLKPPHFVRGIQKHKHHVIHAARDRIVVAKIHSRGERIGSQANHLLNPPVIIRKVRLHQSDWPTGALSEPDHVFHFSDRTILSRLLQHHAFNCVRWIRGKWIFGLR